MTVLPAVAADQPISSTCGEAQTAKVNGSSMLPVLKPGQVVDLLVGWYNCHEVARGDLVTFRFSVRPTAMVKRVVALPGDTVGFTPRGELRVNDVPVYNTDGKLYRFNKDQQGRLLKSTVQANLLPGRYLLLAEEIHNDYDSRRFGAVFKTQIEAKVLMTVKTISNKKGDQL